MSICIFVDYICCINIVNLKKKASKLNDLIASMKGENKVSLGYFLIEKIVSIFTRIP
jgi:hypothetical protein